MIIQCTQALLKELGIRQKDVQTLDETETFSESFIRWHANIVHINRKKAIVLMNDITRYPILLYGMKKKDFKKFDVLVLQAIEEALALEGVRQELVKLYLDQGREFVFAKTANRKMTAWLNNTVSEAQFMGEHIDESSIIQPYHSFFTSKLLQNFFEKDERDYPNERIAEALRSWYEAVRGNKVDSPLDVENYVLKVELQLHGYHIWRKVSVPSSISFKQLHYVIQTVFDWQNYHLHDYTITRDNEKPLIIIPDYNPEFMEYIDEEKFSVMIGQFTRLHEVFPTALEVVYEYDFGDSWEHVITLEKVERTDTLEMKFLGGKGERPPEDVGGESGFERYLAAIHDEHHPDHQLFNTWGKEQTEREQTAAQIERRLRTALRWSSFDHIIYEV
ncbi:MAG TPA: plasmid pRiA4b ORF-3 family protein [Pseudogracilibacillus sp.]|nr:plasmid pRiA4b ORF-3 family protein [Pseudogracilibacillus sp.]